MRLIGMLLMMGLFMLQPHRAEATVKTPVVPGGVLAWEAVEGPVADGALGERPVAWMSAVGRGRVTGKPLIRGGDCSG